MPEEEANLDGWARQLAELEEDAAATGQGRPKCGLCGNTINLTRTECCDNWICDDEWTYRFFSYARNSCHRNHRRYTVCGVHHAEGHGGDWKECEECRDFYVTTEQHVHAGPTSGTSRSWRTRRTMSPRTAPNVEGSSGWRRGVT